MIFNILIVILGCNIETILVDRLQTGIRLANNNSAANIEWFLTGGIKNADDANAVSEAEKMSAFLRAQQTGSATKWGYIYDDHSINTAENFVRLRNMLYHGEKTYEKIYITTSGFHYLRAKKMLELVFEDAIKVFDFEWNLAPASEPDFYYLEKIHIKNVEKDVNAALAALKM